MNVYNAQNEKVGDIKELMLDKNGRVNTVAIGVGGFLGMVDKDVLIGLDQLSLDGDHLKINMTKEQIGALPDFDD